MGGAFVKWAAKKAGVTIASAYVERQAVKYYNNFVSRINRQMAS